MVYKPEIITFLSNLDQCCVEKASSFKKIFDPSMKKGIIFQEGNQWKQNRRLFEPYTHFSKLKEYHKTFLEKTNKMFKKWEKLNLSDTGESFKIDEMIQSLTLNTFMVSLLGLDFDLSENKENNLAEAFIAISKDIQMPKTFGDVISKIPFLKYFTKSYSKVRQARKLRTQFINKILQTSQGDFLASHLKKQGLPKEEIAAHVFTFLLAGHETNKSTLIWLLYELGKRPQLQEELYQEIIEKRKTGDSYADAMHCAMIDSSALLGKYYNIKRFAALNVLFRIFYIC